MPISKIPGAGLDTGSSGVAPGNLTTGGPSWNGSGAVTCLSTISVGNATPATTGAGITFPAAQSASTDANTLDDYEEGTYTPNVYHSSSNNSTWTQKQGKYTKIGNQVTVWGVCDGGNSGTAGSPLRVDLPFTMSGYSNSCGGTAILNGGAANSVAFQLFNGSLYAQLRTIGSDYTSQVSYFGFFVSYTV